MCIRVSNGDRNYRTRVDRANQTKDPCAGIRPRAKTVIGLGSESDIRLN